MNYEVGYSYMFTVKTVEEMLEEGYKMDDFGDINVPECFINEMKKFCGKTLQFICTENSFFKIIFQLPNYNYNFSPEMLKSYNNQVFDILKKL